MTIRRRIQVWFAGLCVLLLSVFATAVAMHSSRAADRALDERLALRADALLGVCEYEDGHLVCELDPTAAMRLPGGTATGAFLVQTLPDLAVIAHGGELAAADLAPASPDAVTPGRRFATRSLGSTFRLLETVCVFENGEHGGDLLLRVVTAEDTAPLQRDLQQLILALALGGIVTLLGVVAAGWLLARRIVDPLAGLAAGAELVQAGRPGTLPRSGSGDEVDQLAATMERAMARLQDAHDRQARFTADAAHELRTPLAIIRTQADVALHQPRETAVYRDTLHEILAGARRMSDILESLLLLARADAGTLEGGEQTLDLGVLARAVLSARADDAATKRLELQFEGPPAAPVLGDARLLTILIDNLVGNAIRYSDGPGKVVVRTAASADGSSLCVVDHGIGIAEDRLPHLFERFFRADADRSRSAGGSGLGLAIVHAVAERHRATCRVQSHVGAGTRFEVVFPRAAA
ncbi:MAG: HAMP domain-containing histidine kinase [Planctomycetes bacterium]|nr:HAMP domain-containing histidine kinase [Planctomycetota bacterium]